MNEYNLMKSEILRRQISYYEDRLLKANENGIVQTENRSLKAIITAFAERIYEDENFSK